jgi:hypothetical protein
MVGPSGRFSNSSESQQPAVGNPLLTSRGTSVVDNRISAPSRSVLGTLP